MATLLTLGQLAERWQQTNLDVVKHQVKVGGLPFFDPSARPGDLRVNWKRARFPLEAVEQFERDHTVVCGRPTDTQATPEPVRGSGKAAWYK